MQAHILSLHTPSNPWVGQKVKTCIFLKVVLLHIKLKRMEHRASCKRIFCPYTHPQHLGWGQMVKTFFFTESCCYISKLREWSIEHYASTYSVLTHTLDPCTECQVFIKTPKYSCQPQALKIWTDWKRYCPRSFKECLIRDRRAAGSSLTGVTALCPWARHVNPCFVLVQPRMNHPNITEGVLTGT